MACSVAAFCGHRSTDYGDSAMSVLAGQSHDGYFEFSRHGQVKHVLGSAKLLSEKGVTTKDGRVYPADMVVFCGGCEYQGSPSFLAELKLGKTQACRSSNLYSCSQTTLLSFPCPG